MKVRILIMMLMLVACPGILVVVVAQNGNSHDKGQQATDTAISAAVSSGAGGGGAGHTGVAENDLFAVDAEDQSILQSDGPIAPRSGDPLSCPKKFFGDGVYFWRDADDLWTVRWLGQQPEAFSIVIDATQPIRVEQVVAADFDFRTPERDTLVISNINGTTGGVAQFRTDSLSFLVDVQVSADTTQPMIFMGRSGDQPNGLPFTLPPSVASAPSAGESRGGAAVSGGQSPTSDTCRSRKNPQSDRLTMPASHSDTQQGGTR